MSERVRRGFFSLSVLWVLPVIAVLFAPAGVCAQTPDQKPGIAPTPGTTTPSVAPPATSSAQAAVTPATPDALGPQPAPVPASPPPLPVKSDAEIKIPVKPEDPRAFKVYSLLEANCARCHQAGKTAKPLASGPISNILDIDALGRNSLFVKPGLPDASRLYDVIVSRHAPLDIYAASLQSAPAASPPPAAQITEPEPDDIEAVRTWIKDLAPQPQACLERKPVTPSEVGATVAAAIKSAKDDPRDLRFLSLAHLYNRCASTEDLTNYRLALVKLLNSLSWSSEPVQVSPLNDTGTVFSFKLSDLGWVSGHWDILQRIYPRGLQAPVPDDVKTLVATDVPVFQADWFADAASKPPLYYALLGIPAKLSELSKMSGIDIDQNIKSARARRAVVRQSDITRGNRMAERHPGARGTFWLSYDFATSSGDQDLFERPLGPKPSTVAKSPFKPDLIRAIFSLPNGFLGYALFDPAGNRIDRVPPGVEKALSGGDETASHQTTRAGANCFECHTQGIKPVRDDLLAHLGVDKFLGPKDVRESALQLTTPDSDMLQFSDGDEDRYRNALKAAGIDPTLRISGLEPVNALARNYQSDGDATIAAAGLGLGAAEFQKILGNAPGPAQVLARRLQTGTLPRPEFDRLLGFLKGPDEGGQAAAKAAKEALKPIAKEDTGAVGLSLWTDKAHLAPGDVIAVYAEADNDCYLTLISVDNRGKATVLFPNDFETDNLLSAGKTVRIPGTQAPYQLRFKDAGQETILGQCSTSPVPPTGVDHDFEKQRFTVLGNWENFVRDVLVSEAELRRNPDRAEKLRAQRANSFQQRRQERSESGDKRLEPPVTSRILRDGRAVIVIGNG